MAIDLYYPTVAEDGSSSPRETAIVIQNLMNGKANNRLDIELDINVATTTITDLRIGPESAVVLVPLDANAAVEDWWISNQDDGSAVVNHANNALVRTFRVAVIG